MRLIPCVLALLVLTPESEACPLSRSRRCGQDFQPCQGQQFQQFQHGYYSPGGCVNGQCPAPTLIIPSTPKEMPKGGKFPKLSLDPSDLLDAVSQFRLDKTGLLDAINAERARRGLSELVLVDELMTAAQGSADAQARYGRIGHFVSLVGFGEICAAGQVSAEDAVQSWLSSPGHREMMLGNCTKMGGGRNGPFWAVQFGR